MTKVNFYDSINDSMLKFAVIIARHNGKWVFCKHKERNTHDKRMNGYPLPIPFFLFFKLPTVLPNT